jgi:shikimate dehydrogenase
VIHNAGYAAVGLDSWSYTAVECAESELAALVGGLDPSWRGLSLTMPLKEVALTVADRVDPLAEALGAANTLVPRLGGWYATNTDAPGMVDALRAAGVSGASSVAVFGAGGTARAALAATSGLGANEVTVYARRPEAVSALAPVAAALGVRLRRGDLANAWMAAGADVVISTLPAGVADSIEIDWRAGTVLFDAIYHPWPTPLAASAQRAGLAVVSGLDLLLTQAVHQFELFTGLPAPVAEMDAALRVAAAAR